MIEQARKDSLVAVIRQRMQRWYDEQPKEEKGAIGAYCLWWAAFTVAVLSDAGIPAQLQAGSAFWRRMRADQDDGVSPLDFGYGFGDRHSIISALASGMLPEMHVWAAVAACGQDIERDSSPVSCKNCKELYCSFCSVYQVDGDDVCFGCKHAEDVANQA